MTSQFGQDLFVLKVLGNLRGGFFLDSGAADGLNGSNTELFERALGWKGICVEPNEALFASLVRNRCCYRVNCCLYDHDGYVEFVEQGGELGGILDEYHPAYLQHTRATFGLPADTRGRPATVRKPALTVRSVLRECEAPAVIDYWSLDTEGSELKILKTFPFNEYSVRVITVEHNWFPVRGQILEFLESRGYRRIAELAVDDCYIQDGQHGMKGLANWG
jgi:hypothetical protein